MTQRLGLVLLAFGIVSIVACGEDAPDSSAADAGPSLPSPAPTLKPQLDVRVAPVVLIRDQSVRVPVQVYRRDTLSTLQLVLQGAPAGVQTGAPIALPPEASTTELTVAASKDAGFGDFTMQLLVTGPDLPQSIVPIPIQVRGAPGSLDTSFGAGGSAVRVPNGMIGDVMVDAEGRYVIAGGYNAPADAMLMARLTPTGQMDPSFGTAGLLRWSAPFGYNAHYEMRPGYYRRALREHRDGYSLTAYLESDQKGLVVHSETPQAGTAPVIVPASMPETNLGNVAGGPRVIRDVRSAENDGGFFHFRTGCRVERRFVGNQLDINWGNGGGVELWAAGGCTIVDAVDTPESLYVLMATSGVYRLTALDRDDGTNRYPSSPEVASGPVHLSRPNPEGRVLAVYGTTPSEITRDGRPRVLKGTRFDAALEPRSATSSFPFYFADGSIGILVFGASPVLHRLTPEGEQLGPAAGVALQDPQFGQFKAVVEAFPDARGGLVLVYPEGTAEPLFEHWTIRRFWL